MGRYTLLPSNTFENLQMNAGILCYSFDPDTGVVNDIIGATTGGVQIDATPSFKDLGEDIDNCPKNTKEVKDIESWECKVSGTYLTATTSSLANLIGAADIDGNHISLRNKLISSDFKDIWFVGDYGDNGYLAVKLSNALNTKGFSFKSEKDSKGQLSFEYLGHSSITNTEKVPMDIYMKSDLTVYQVKYNLSNVTATIKPTEVAQGASLIVKIEANEGGSLPDTITVKSGSTTLEEDTGYTYSPISGTICVLSNSTTADITIEAA